MSNLSPTPSPTAGASERMKVTRLKNGVRVATALLPIRTTTVTVFANVGNRNETEAENGLSHFLEHMAFKGTEARTAKDIVLTVERLGADINAFTSRNMTAYFVTGMAEHTTTALDILQDAVLNSVFAPADVESEKEVVVQEIYESYDDLGDLAMNALSATAYPDQPLGRSILGPEETVRSFTRDMLNSYLLRNYHASNLIVTAVGDVDHDAFVALAEARFGAVQTLPESAPQPAAYVGGTALVRDESYEQSQVFLAFQAPGLRDKRGYATHDLLADVLGGGMSSPLFQEVREERGLCYSIGSGMLPQADSTLFIIKGATTPQNLNEFLSTSATELAKIAAGNITDDDWERARNQNARQIAQRDEKALTISRTIASDLFIFGDIHSTDDLLTLYRSVTREDVIAAAKALLKSEPTIIIAGNAPEADYGALVKAALV